MPVFAESQQDPFAVVLMVKDEALVICKTLDAYIKEGINSFLIFDTGSTDNTVDVVRDYFKKNDITNWHIFQEPFVDFATSRNRALDLADETFSDAAFFLMPDAEWYMHNVKGLIDFCHGQKDDPCTCYLVRINNERLDFCVPRLIRAHVKARFVNRVHEVIVADLYKKIPQDIFFELGMSRVGIEKSKKRWERDLKFLSEDYEKKPDDPRTTFYLAQTYECLEDFTNAYIYYKIRSKQEGWSEETYEALYRLGRVTELLSQKDQKYTWHMAQDYYFEAHKMLPHRAEPLIKIAEHYWPDGQPADNIALCYLFAKRAMELSYPINDVLFIDPEVYDFKRYELVSKSAYHAGDFTLGEAATRIALKKKEMPYLLRNLACYLEMTQKN